MHQYIRKHGKPHKISYWRENDSRAAKFFALQSAALVSSKTKADKDTLR